MHLATCSHPSCITIIPRKFLYLGALTDNQLNCHASLDFEKEVIKAHAQMLKLDLPAETSDDGLSPLILQKSIVSPSHAAILWYVASLSTELVCFLIIPDSSLTFMDNIAIRITPLTFTDRAEKIHVVYKIDFH